MDIFKQLFLGNRRESNEKVGTAGIRKMDGKYLMYLDGQANLELPKKYGQPINIALNSEKRRGNSKYEKTTGIRDELNCLRSLWVLLGVMSLDEVKNDKISDLGIWDAYRIAILPEGEYEEVYHFSELERKIQERLKDSFGVLQMVNYPMGELVVQHSVFCGLDTKKRIVCFEKIDFEGQHKKISEKRFQVVGLGEIYDRYYFSEYSWGVGNVEDIDLIELRNKIGKYNELDNKFVREEIRSLIERYKKEFAVAFNGMSKEEVQKLIDELRSGDNLTGNKKKLFQNIAYYKEYTKLLKDYENNR